MGRTKGFNQEEVINIIGEVFIKKGFNGTSLDDIVKGTGVLRGSLYSAFGSKLGMFTAALTASLSNYSKQKNLELVLIAMLEVAPNNKEVRSILNKWYEANNQTDIAEKIGLALLKRSGIGE